MLKSWVIQKLFQWWTSNKVQFPLAFLYSMFSEPWSVYFSKFKCFTVKNLWHWRSNGIHRMFYDRSSTYLHFSAQPPDGFLSRSKSIGDVFGILFSLTLWYSETFRQIIICQNYFETKWILLTVESCTLCAPKLSTHLSQWIASTLALMSKSCFSTNWF